VSPTISKPMVVRSPEERGAVGRDPDPYRQPCAERKIASATVRYEAIETDLFWLAHVKRDFRLEPRPGGWGYRGDCPRCCHPIEAPMVRVRDASGLQVTITIECGCGVPHPDAPSGWRGCGRSGRVAFDVPWVADTWKR
jgi:hypothetical protein